MSTPYVAPAAINKRAMVDGIKGKVNSDLMGVPGVHGLGGLAGGAIGDPLLARDLAR